ncbi:PEGA domain-containing protein [Haliangium sp.]|uniref:PEGA domain-containing protein n=1 Tax=Haliangium sp. TaxID=2663208 RepID=UPI003D119E23
MIRTILLTILCAVVLSWAAPVLAQQGDPASAADEAGDQARSETRRERRRRRASERKLRREADRHFKNGVTLFDDRKYAEALAEFEKAYALAPHPLVLYNLAGAHRALSQYDQAVDFYNRFLHDGAGVVRDRALAKGRQELEELLALVALVDIRTEPAGATVFTDGREVGPSPLDDPLVLGPGDHVIEARLDGYDTAERELRVAAGDEVTVELTLTETPVAPPSPPPPRPIDPAPVLDRPAPAPLPPPRLGVRAAYGTNALALADTGAPVVGVAYALTSRLSVDLDVVVPVLSAVPSVRYRIFGDALSVHGVVAVPVSFRDAGQTDVFVAAAGGVGVRYRALRSLSFRIETWVSYAGPVHGTTLPTFAGAEMWF